MDSNLLLAANQLHQWKKPPLRTPDPVNLAGTIGEIARGAAGAGLQKMLSKRNLDVEMVSTRKMDLRVIPVALRGMEVKS
jgi:hypothetical protein